MTDTEKFEPVLGELAQYIEHGDFMRIAKVCIRPDGQPYTSDYVRKTLLKLRANKLIVRKAKGYFRKKKKIHEALSS